MAKKQPPRLTQAEIERVEQQANDEIKMIWRRALEEPPPAESVLPSQVLRQFHDLQLQIAEANQLAEAQLKDIQRLLEKFD